LFPKTQKNRGPKTNWMKRANGEDSRSVTGKKVKGRTEPKQKQDETKISTILGIYLKKKKKTGREG